MSRTAVLLEPPRSLTRRSRRAGSSTSRPAQPWSDAARRTLRPARHTDATAIHALVGSHAAEGRLLPRTLEDIERHVDRFVVLEIGGLVQACAELAPLSRTTAEIRSLVVASDIRRQGVAARLVAELERGARERGHDVLCVFTHDPRFFVRQNFSIAPHTSFPAKIAKDCVECPRFRHCGQYAMTLSLVAVTPREVTNAGADHVTVL